MRGAVHMRLGIASGLLIGYTYLKIDPSIVNAVGLGLGCAMGSVLPDLDVKQSIAAKDHPITSFVARHAFGHRGILHTPFASVFIGAFLITLASFTPIPASVSYGTVFGMLLHFAQDSFTRRGIMWLYPIKRQYYRMAYTIQSGRHALIEDGISILIFLGLIGICLLVPTK